MSFSAKWKTMAKFPFFTFSAPLQINNKEIMVLPQRYHNSHYDLCAGDGVYKFNVAHNEWVKLVIDYDKETPNFFCSAIAFNKEAQTIYIWVGGVGVGNEPVSLYSLNLNTKKSQQITTFESCDSVTQIIHIQDELHLFNHSYLPRMNSVHFVWNEQTNETQEIHQFEKIPYRHELKYIQSTNKLLLIGGNGSDLIYEYCLKNKKWQKWEVKIPLKLELFGVVVLANTFLIIFGGVVSTNSGHSLCDDIFVCDMKKKKSMFKSSIKCPQKAPYHAFITKDIDRDNLLCFGFIARCSKSKNMKNVHLSPCIIQLIGKWIDFQYVHLMNRGTGDHYKMNVDDILQTN
eukprot:728145_1